MNYIEEKKERLKYLQAKKLELIRRRIEIENNMLGKYDSVIYVGSSYAEMLFGVLNKNLSQVQYNKLKDRYHKLRVASKKAYNQYNVAMLKKVKEQDKRVRKELRQGKFLLDKMVWATEYYSKQELFSPKELFGKDTYYDLTDDEKKVYLSVNERAKKEIERGD